MIPQSITFPPLSAIRTLTSYSSLDSYLKLFRSQPSPQRWDCMTEVFYEGFVKTSNFISFFASMKPPLSVGFSFCISHSDNDRIFFFTSAHESFLILPQFNLIFSVVVHFPLPFGLCEQHYFVYFFPLQETRQCDSKQRYFFARYQRLADMAGSGRNYEASKLFFFVGHSTIAVLVRTIAKC